MSNVTINFVAINQLGDEEPKLRQITTMANNNDDNQLRRPTNTTNNNMKKMNMEREQPMSRFSYVCRCHYCWCLSLPSRFVVAKCIVALIIVVVLRHCWLFFFFVVIGRHCLSSSLSFVIVILRCLCHSSLPS